jgi:hypothetical protein
MKKGTIRPASSALAVLSSLLLLASGARADDVSSQVSAQPTMYVGKLGAHAEPLPTEASHRPSSGWLIKGVFYAMDENSRLISVPFVHTDKGPNVEVSVTVTDYALNPDIPFAVIGSEAALRGQGTAISWNPYVAAAKFVLHQVKGQDSIDVLATQIAQKIIDERQRLLEHDHIKSKSLKLYPDWDRRDSLNRPRATTSLITTIAHRRPRPRSGDAGVRFSVIDS